MFLDYNGIKLYINNWKIAEKSQHIWKWNNILISKNGLKKSLQGKTYFELNENENIKIFIM